MSEIPPFHFKTEADSSHFLHWKEYAFPIDWAQHFGVDESALRLNVEVGFGDGRYTVRQALERPQEQFVGFEIASVSVQRALKSLQKHGIHNVRVVKLGAEFALRHLFPEHSLQSIVVNFPDPWPKERHEGNRLLQTQFFELASTRLLEQGDIRLATDHLEYLAFARAQAQASQLYDLVSATAPEAVFETKYALKWKSQGKPLFYQIFRRHSRSEKAFPPLERSIAMPHAIFKGALPEKIPFHKQVLDYGEGHVVLHEAMQSWSADTGGRILVRATSDEPKFKQQLLVVIKERKENELLVLFERFGDPIITPTSRGAIHATVEWLRGNGTDLELVKRDY